MLKQPKNLLNYLPPILHDKKEYIQICKTEDVEINKLFTNINSLFDNLFLESLNLQGVKRWEKMLKITPKQSETLEDRRFRIITRYLTNLPYTKRSLHTILATLCGKDGYKLDINHEKFIVKVKVALGAKHKIDEVKFTLRKVVPANMSLDVNLLYNTHEILSNFTFEELSKFTHEQLREEELLHERNNELQT